MVVNPQNTKFQVKVIENLKTLSVWANNPWRRYSMALIVVLLGYLFGSSLGMVSAVVELMDPVGALISIIFIEILIQIRRSLRLDKTKKILVLILDSLRIGLFYGFFTESLKLL